MCALAGDLGKLVPRQHLVAGGVGARRLAVAHEPRRGIEGRGNTVALQDGQRAGQEVTESVIEGDEDRALGQDVAGAVRRVGCKQRRQEFRHGHGRVALLRQMPHVLVEHLRGDCEPRRLGGCNVADRMIEENGQGSHAAGTIPA